MKDPQGRPAGPASLSRAAAVPLGRRGFLGAFGLGLLLAGCASPGAGGAPAATPASGAPTGTLPAGVSENALGAQSLALGAPVTGGTLTVGLSAPVEALDPAGSVASNFTVLRAIFDVLFVYNEAGNVVPELAESLATDDGGTTWTMKLPAGLKFTDGTDFNADAVVQHLTRLGAEGSQSRAAADVRQIARMEAADETTVTMVLKAANMTFPKIFVWGQPGGPSMIPSPASIKKYGNRIGSHPVGVGPFKLKSFQSGADIVLERNEDYRRPGQPYLDGLRFVNATDSQTRLSAAVSGDIDLAATQSGSDLADAAAAGLTPLYQPEGQYFNLLFNLAIPPFQDLRFRKALLHAVDVDSLNKAVFDGLNNPMRGMFPSGNPYYKDTGWPAYNPEEARRLVQEVVADGGAAAFTLTATSTPEMQSMAQIIQQMAADAGIALTIKNADQPSMVTEALSGNYEAQVRYTGIHEEVDQQLRQLYYSTSTGNNGKAGNKRVDGLLDELRTAAGQAHKAEIYAELQDALTEWLPIGPLVAHRNGWYVRSSVAGFPGNRVGASDPDWALVWAKA